MQHTPLSEFRRFTDAQGQTHLDVSRQWPITSLFGQRLVCADRKDMARHIIERVSANDRATINFVNAHCINIQRDDQEYRDALIDSDLLLPDGIGIEVASAMCGVQIGDNLNGTDLFPELCREAEEEGVSLFLLGGVPEVAAGAASWAKDHFSELRIAGTHSGFFKENEEDTLIEQINQSRAGLLLVGMGVPLQEKWIARNRHRLNASVVMGVGGLFDYYSGRIPRAPQVVRACKSEWMWRLAMEPRRMAMRYIWGNASFLAHAVIEALRTNDTLNAYGKRALDIVVSSLAILALLPVFLATAFAIRLEDKGPILFRQTRIGEGGNPFSMVKFRSMYTDAEARRAALLAQSDRDGACFKMREDPRITRIGKFIRRFSIDELPQLFNVLSGAMSLVGPRPALASEVAAYRGTHWERLKGKPGITCTWQIKGRAEIPFERQAIMDRAYLKKTNLWIDLKLLLCTPGAVFSGRGAY